MYLNMRFSNTSLESIVNCLPVIPRESGFVSAQIYDLIAAP